MKSPKVSPRVPSTAGPVGRLKLTARPAALALCLAAAAAALCAAYLVLPASSAQAPEAIETFAADCTTPQTKFHLGDTVCAKVTGAPANQRRFLWANPAPLRERLADVTTATQTDSFTLPGDATTEHGGVTVDNRGLWRVNSISNSDGSARATAYFTVSEENNPIADLSLSNLVRVGASGVAPGASVSFAVYVRNEGPDAAANVELSDAVPAGTTFVTASQDEGPAFDCTHPAAEATGTSTCTIASLPPNTSAAFTFVYEVDTGLTNGTDVTNTASIATETGESKADNNSLSASAKVSTPACAVNVPGHITVNNALGQGGATVTYDQPTTSGSCGAVTCDIASGSFFPIGTTAVTCTDATSGAGDSFFVTVNDTEAPTVSCPASVSGFESPAGSGFGPASFPAPVAADNGAVDVSLSHQSGDLFPVGTTTVTATATDASQNTATCSFTVTIAPSVCTLGCPGDIVVSEGTPGSGEAAVTFGSPTEAGSCGTVTYSHAPGSTFNVGTTTVTATAHDANNDPIPGGTCSFTVTVTAGADTTPPLITCPGNVTQTVDANSCSAASVNVGTATATDNNPNGIVVTGVRGDGAALGAPYPAGQVAVLWTARDQAGNESACTQLVTVVDGAGPTFTAPAPRSVNADASCNQVEVPDFTLGLDLADGCSPLGELTVTQSPAPGTLVGVGPHTITITATDGSNNTTVRTTTFTVNDTTPPTLTLNGPAESTIECGSTYADPGATAADACAGNLTGAVQVSGSVNPNVPGTYVLTYSVTDGSNLVTATRTVHVADTTPPALSCPANVVVHLPLNSTATSMPVSFPAPTASDNCGGATVATSHASGSVFPVGTTVVTVTATDEHGHTSSCSFTVTVLYNFAGFLSPVENLPTVNQVNAGRAVPVKFSLSGNKGLAIFAADSPSSAQYTCGASDPTVDLTQTLEATANSISYDASSDQYNFVWKTEKAWAGTCRQLVVQLNDGSLHRANFKFK